MQLKPPEKIAIDHDDHHAQNVGRTYDDRQFFLTSPFVPNGHQFVALYLFDGSGKFLESKIELLDPLKLDDEVEISERLLAELNPVDFQRIEVEPFCVEKFGITFGLIPRTLEENEASLWVELQPGNYMAFHEPWDSGEYST